MGRFEKISALAKEKNVPIRTIIVKHLEPLKIRTDVCNRFNKGEEDDLEPDDLYQLCDTPPSQKKLINYF
jgi:hypothetical protein